MAKEAGAQLGRYEILGQLGAGGMGEVYRARDPGLDRLVALKVISDEFARNPTWRERFRREARILAALSHPNIAVIYGVEEDADELLLSMELVEGQSLVELVRAGGMPVERLLKIAIQIADALAAAHASRITHRDLKPGNVLISTDSRVKVLDFGLAKLAQRPEGSDATTVPPPNDLTEEGHVVGTASYMSPEQAEGKPIDYRSDIFSFGIVLYELATGERPFKGQSVLSILSSIVRDTPPPALEINPRLPRELSRVIRRCLAKEPEERYQSAKDLRNDLSDLRQDLSSGEALRVLPASTRRLWWRRGTAVAAGLALTASGWWAGQYLRGNRSAFLPTNIAQLTFDPGVELGPSISPDGKWIVYAKRGPQRNDIFLQAVGGETAINLTKNGDGGSEPAFSPDGEQIAFRSRGGLYVMGRTGELARRVNDAGFNPSWSPDGKRLAYSTSAAGDFPSAHPGGAELWIVDIASGEKRRLSAHDALQPAWSPDDKRIAYWGVDPVTHQRDLWTIPLGAGTPTRVTNDAATEVSPSWSADGRYLYFSSDRGGTTNLWRVRIDSSTGGARGPFEPVTAPNVNAVHANVSQDGRRLVYATYTWNTDVFSAAFDPVKLEVQGSPTWLLGGSHLWTAVRISPDASRLALVRWSQQQDLFLFLTDGSGLRRVTSDPLGVRCPEWSPDSKRIAYMRNVQTDGSILFVEVSTGNVGRLSTDNVGGSFGCPAWSRDGTRIAIVQGPPTPGAYIFSLAQPGSPATSERLPTPPEESFIPRSWSPDNQSLAGTIGTRVALYSVSTKKYDVLTKSGAATRAANTQWLPGGRQILFVNPSGTELFVVDVASKAVKRVFTITGQVIRGASLSSDGRQLFFSLGPEEGDIWIATMPEDR